MFFEKSKKKTHSSFIKTWAFPANSDWKALHARMRLIEKISLSGLRSFPPITHTARRNVIIQTMPLIRSRKFNNLILKELEHLAADIDRMHEAGLTHGDIHPKNILYDGSKFVLVDFEPYLQYVEMGTHLFNITPPWISHYDYTRKKLSFRTDRIGFFHSAYVILNGRKPINNILWTLKQRKSFDYPILDMISDGAVYRKNCKKILWEILQNG